MKKFSLSANSRAASRVASRARRGFTLVEILIVIAIIGILAAIAFPVFSRAREGARRTACSNNLKQLGVAFQQYTQDSGGRYPFAATYYTDPGKKDCFAASCSGWIPGAGNWVVGQGLTPTSSEAEINDSKLTKENPSDSTDINFPTGKKASPENGSLFQYAKSTSIFFCPSNQYGQEKRLSYSMNCALASLSEVRIKAPSDIVLLVDEEGANDGFFSAVNNSLAGATGNSTDALTKKHNGGGNLLFADGHVKFYTNKGFVLDDSDTGKANKWKTAGAPRFHDRAFGQFGSSKPSVTLGSPADYCDAKAGPGNDTGTANTGAAAVPPGSA